MCYCVVIAVLTFLARFCVHVFLVLLVTALRVLVRVVMRFVLVCIICFMYRRLLVWIDGLCERDVMWGYIGR